MGRKSEVPSGRITVRMSPVLHSNLNLLGASLGISVNDLIVDAIVRAMPAYREAAEEIKKVLRQAKLSFREGQEEDFYLEQSGVTHQEVEAVLEAHSPESRRAAARRLDIFLRGLAGMCKHYRSQLAEELGPEESSDGEEQAGSK